MCSATGCTPLLPTSFQRKVWSRKGTWVLDLVVSLFVYCGEKADPIENELATLLADLRSFLGTGVEVLSSPDDGFWSALGGNTILDVGEFRDEQSSVSLSRKATARSPFRWRASVSARWDGIEDGNFSKGAAPSRGEKKYNPSSLSAVPKAHKAEIQLSMVGAREKPVSPELIREPGGLIPMPPGCRHRVEQFVVR